MSWKPWNHQLLLWIIQIEPPDVGRANMEIFNPFHSHSPSNSQADMNSAVKGNRFQIKATTIFFTPTSSRGNDYWYPPKIPLPQHSNRAMERNEDKPRNRLVKMRYKNDSYIYEIMFRCTGNGNTLYWQFWYVFNWFCPPMM